MDWLTIVIALAPQHILLLGFLMIMLSEMLIPILIPFIKKDQKINTSILSILLTPKLYAYLAVLTIIVSFIITLVLFNSNYSAVPFPNQFSISPQKLIMVLLILFLAIPPLIYAINEHLSSRFYMLLLASIYGASIIPTTDSFVALFLSVEMTAIPVYALVTMPSKNSSTKLAAEAAIKYLIIGSIATSTILLGISFFIGSSQSTSIAISDFVNSANQMFGSSKFTTSDALLSLSIAFLLLFLFIKSSIVPFHTWSPDAYGSSSLSVTVFMSVVIKLAVFLVALKVFADTNFTALFISIIFIFLLISVLWGNIAAINQSNFRRFIGYSSIAHAGYLFYAFLGPAGGDRIIAVGYYAIVYGLASFLAFLALPTFAAEKKPTTNQIDDLANLKGMFYQSPFFAIMLAISMLSLAGLPPFPGFIGKFLIFKNVMSAGLTVYAVIGLLASFTGLFVYLRIAQLVFNKNDSNDFEAKPIINYFISLICLLALIGLLVFPQSYFELFY